MMKRLFLLSLIICACSQAHSQIVINEVCVSNGDIIYDPTYFNFPGWVELYNNGNSSVNIGGYYLSNRLDLPMKWKIPTNTTIASKGYLIIWCDNNRTSLHSNFTLGINGEDLILTQNGIELDKVSYPKQYTNISYGRYADGGTDWTYMGTPTPAKSNNQSKASERLENPKVSLKAGRYTGTQSVTLSHPKENAAIYYTIDGSEPSIGSSIYTAPIEISKTLTLKAIAFHNDFIPSKTEVKTYFINEHNFTLPVISLSTKPTYLTDTKIGIYVVGSNGIDGNCYGTANWNRDWDRHAEFEFFESNGEKKFDQSVDIRVGGACSRTFAQKSLVVRAREEYGKDVIEESFFPSKDIKEFGSVFLRNSGNDFNVTSFRDAFMQSLAASQMDIDYMAYQPSALYINGNYWGIQSLREKIDGDYIKANYGIDKNDIDLLDTYSIPVEGTNKVYTNYINKLGDIDLSDPASFEFIDSHIDVQEYINYLMSEIYYANTDWPGNNVKLWRQRSTNGKFRWIFWDTDFGFGLATDAYHPTLNFATATDGPGWPNPPWATFHIRSVLQNPIFRVRFIQTLTTAMNTTFKPDRVINVINEFKDQLKYEMPYHKKRWGGTMDDWNYEVQRLRDFATQRNEFMQQHTADFFGLSEKIQFTVSTSPANCGAFKMNGIVSAITMTNAPYFKDLPYQIEPLPNPGYVFKEWKIKIGSDDQFINTNSFISDTAKANIIMEAVFMPDAPRTGLVINEFCAGKSDIKDDHDEASDWIEIYNAGAETVNLSGLYLTDNLNKKTKYKIAANAGTLAPGAYILFWADDDIQQGPKHLNFKLSADGDDVGLFQLIATDTVAFDEFEFDNLDDNVSYSRIPNGTGPFFITSKLTPGDENILITSINDEPSLNSNVYPNPAGGNIYIKTAKAIDVIIIYDIMGRPIKQFKNIESEAPISIEDLQPGIYLLKVKADAEETLIRIIKQ